MRKRYSIRLASVAATTLFANSAFAGAPGATGSALSDTDAACFQRATSGVVSNICEDPAIWCMGDHVPTRGGRMQVSVNAAQPTETDELLRCSVTAFDKTGAYANSAQSTLSVVNSSADLPPVEIEVPPAGSFYVCCVLDNQARVNTMQYYVY